MSEEAPNPPLATENPLEAPLAVGATLAEPSTMESPAAQIMPSDLLSGDPSPPPSSNKGDDDDNNDKNDDPEDDSSSSSGSSSSGESSSDSEEDDDDEEASPRRARPRKARRYRDEPLEVEQGNNNNNDNDSEYHEDFEQEHDQLPSAEEIKASVFGPNRSSRRFVSVLRRFCDFTTFTLTCFLIALIMIFLFSLLIPEFAFRSHDATDGSDFDPADDHGDYSETPATSAPQYSLIAATLINNGIALANGGEFTNSGTYQSKALAFMEMPEHSAIYEQYDITQLKSVYALLCLYYHTNFQETSWHQSIKWLHTTDYCHWTGVKCSFDLAVVRLDLANGGLEGLLPVELMHLESTLTDLLLDDNPGLTGQIPSFLGEMDLKRLFLTDCGFSGSMPSSICAHKREDEDFDLNIDCGKIFCQQACCDFCE